MLSTILSNAEAKLKAVKSLLLLLNFREKVVEESKEAALAVFKDNQLASTFSREDRIIRHCAAITSIYSTFEGFVDEVISFWLSNIPKYKTFLELDSSFQKQYRVGISTIIKDLEKRKFEHLKVEDVVNKYSAGLNGEPEWTCVTEAITYREANLRKEQIEMLFSRIGINGLWTELQKDPFLVEKCDELEHGQNIEKAVSEFIDFRNDASHGAVDNIIGFNQLVSWSEFFLGICNVINRIVVHDCLTFECAKNPNVVLAEITETYRDNIMVARFKSGTTVTVGDSLLMHRTESTEVVKIQNIQENGNDLHSFTTTMDNSELGIKIDRHPNKKAKLIRIAF